MYEMIQRCFLFQHLSTEKITLLMKNIKYKTLVYKKGQYIYNFNKELAIILKGKIEVQKNLSTGKKIIMNRLKAGNIFGIVCLFEGNFQDVTSLLVNSESTILFIGEKDLLRLLQQDEIILKSYLQYVNQRIYFLNQRVECFTHETIRDRVVEFMEQLKNQQNLQNQDVLFSTKSELAEYLGISRSSLYRILKKIEEEKNLK